MSPRIIWAGGSLAEESRLLTEATSAGAVIIRRCVDAAELLAAAALEPSAVVVLTPSVTRLDAEVVARIAAGGRMVIGLADGAHDADVLTAWQATRIIGTQESGLLTRVLGDAARAGAGGGVWQAPVPQAIAGGISSAAPPIAPLIAVWGPHGAPGRSRTALGIADELARSGVSCCLVDADLAAPSLDLDLGVIADASGLLVAGRQADRGLLTPAGVQASARIVRPRLSLLTGLPGPQGSADLRPAAMRGVLAAARGAFEVVVVDVGACALERALPRPVTADHDAQDVSDAVLEQASLLVAVAADSPLGIARLVRAWRPVQAPVVVGLVAGRRTRQAVQAIAESGIAAPIERIRRDEHWERAGRTGATLAELAPRARVRGAYRRLAERGLRADRSVGEPRVPMSGV